MNTKAYFSITYQIQAPSEKEAQQFSAAVATEQSVEMPTDAVPPNLKKNIGSVESVSHINKNSWKAIIQFPGSLVDNDPTQFLNVLFGNSSLQPGIKVLDIDRKYLSQICHGPVHGIKQFKKKLGIEKRPLSCTALKPIGLTPGELAERAYQFTRGGIDMIKDDHGIANQSSASFKARVQSVVRAVRKGEQISGKKTAYFPNITGSAAELIDRYMQAVELGADGVLISPQLTGLTQMHQLAASNMPLPIMAHPAFSGNFVNHPTGGFLPEIYYGLLWRAFGADFVIYPNTQGRFSFS
ncbi:MAG: RuBisCO large subunit C-terminal-like domain-containing protein, partial [Balneolaceae bacterium]